MKNGGLTVALVALRSASAAASCNVDSFSSILADAGTSSTASVVYATAIAEGGSSFDPSPPFQQNATGLPELCAAKIEVQSSENSSYRFAIFLPTEWNERMMTTGNGGFGGGINYPDMGHLSHYGFASVSTDTGHLSASPDGTWALNAPESIIDWGWRAMHGSVTLGKEVISRYYDSDIQRSYYAGCSTGGRQGLKEMQISPDSFDGILAGAPAWWTTHLQSWTTWYPLQNYPPDSPGHIPAASFASISAAIDAQCDAQDGIADNITQNPFACIIDYTALNLTDPQVTTLQTLYRNWTSSSGAFLFPSLSPGTLLMLADSQNPNPLGYTFYSYFVKNDTSYNFTDFSEADDLAQADATNPGAANADAFGGVAPFAARGGKLLMYHGLYDPAIPVGSSMYYYNRTRQVLQGGDDNDEEKANEKQGHGRQGGNVDVDDFFRLFLVPNMGHCSGSMPAGSDAPWYFGAASQGGSSGAISGAPVPRGLEGDARSDAILALVRWVEEGVAPREIVATNYGDGDGSGGEGVVRQGVVCAWPEQAVWDGVGDVRVESSWSCA